MLMVGFNAGPLHWVTAQANNVVLVSPSCIRRRWMNTAFFSPSSLFFFPKSRWGPADRRQTSSAHPRTGRSFVWFFAAIGIVRQSGRHGCFCAVVTTTFLFNNNDAGKSITTFVEKTLEKQCLVLLFALLFASLPYQPRLSFPFLHSVVKRIHFIKGRMPYMAVVPVYIDVVQTNGCAMMVLHCTNSVLFWSVVRTTHKSCECLMICVVVSMTFLERLVHPLHDLEIE